MNNQQNLIAALRNFQQAFDQLATAWIDSGVDLSHDYPFAGSFDEVPVNKWVASSLVLLCARSAHYALHNRLFETKVFTSVDDANDFIRMRPEYSVLVEDFGVIHVALTSDKGQSVKPLNVWQDIRRSGEKEYVPTWLNEKFEQPGYESPAVSQGDTIAESSVNFIKELDKAVRAGKIIIYRTQK